MTSLCEEPGILPSPTARIENRPRYTDGGLDECPLGLPIPQGTFPA
jgi:hypothetical protein